MFPASGDRSGKAQSRTPDVYAGEESDRVAVPMQLPNKEAEASAEAVEGRARTKENTCQSRTPPAQDGRGVSQGLAGVRKAARERKSAQPLHHLRTLGLVDAYAAAQSSASPARTPRARTWRGPSALA